MILRWFVIALAFFAVILFGSGIALTVRGAPYAKGGAMAVHEGIKFLFILALLGSIVLAFLADRAHGPSPTEWVLYALAIIFVAIAAIVGEPVAGGSASPLAVWAHRITPWLGGVFAAFGLYLRIRGL